MYDPNQHDPNWNYPNQNYPNYPYQNYPPPKREGSAWAGIGLTIVAHIIFQPLIALL